MTDGVTAPGGWHDLPRAGAELVRGGDGTNPHTLVADRGSCRLTIWVIDPESLAVAAIHNTKPVYLVHPEHGATGIAPGRWLVRRQREESGVRRIGSSLYRGGPVLIAD